MGYQHVSARVTTFISCLKSELGRCLAPKPRWAPEKEIIREPRIGSNSNVVAYVWGPHFVWSRFYKFWFFWIARLLNLICVELSHSPIQESRPITYFLSPYGRALHPESPVNFNSFQRKLLAISLVVHVDSTTQSTQLLSPSSGQGMQQAVATSDSEIQWETGYLKCGRSMVIPS